MPLSDKSKGFEVQKLCYWKVKALLLKVRSLDKRDNKLNTSILQTHEIPAVFASKGAWRLRIREL